VSVHIPEAAQALLELVVGSDWPDGDEDALRALSAVWSGAASELQEIQQTASSLAASVGQVAKGAAADAFAAHWAKNIDDGQSSWGKGASPPILPFSVSFCQQMAKACDDGALEIETAKEMVVGQLLLLAAELAGTDVLGMFTFGLADLGDIAEVAATRVVCKEIINEAVTKVITKMLAAAIEMGVTQGVLDLAIQTIQVAEHRRSFSATELLEATGSGALAGALGAGFGMGVSGLGRVGAQEGLNALGRAAETKLGTVATAVAGGGFTNAAMDLAQNGQVSLSDLTKGSLGGAIGAAHGVHAEMHLPEGVAETEIPASAADSAVFAGGAPSGSLHTTLAGLDTHFNPDGSVHQDAAAAADTASAPVAQVTVPHDVHVDTNLSGFDGGLGGGSGSHLSEQAPVEASVATDRAAFPSERTQAPAPSGTPFEDTTRASLGLRPETVTGDRPGVPEPRTSEPASTREPLREAIQPTEATLPRDATQPTREGTTVSEPLEHSAPAEPAATPERSTVSEPSAAPIAETASPTSTDTRPVHDPGTAPEADGHAATGLSGVDLADQSVDRTTSDGGGDRIGQDGFTPPENQEGSAGGDRSVSPTGDDASAGPQPVGGPASAGLESGGTSGVVNGGSGRNDGTARTSTAYGTTGRSDGATGESTAYGTAGRNDDAAGASPAYGATRPAPSPAEAPRVANRASDSAVPVPATEWAPATDRAPSADGQIPANPAPHDQNDGSAVNTQPVVATVAVPVDMRTMAPSHDMAQSSVPTPDRAEGSGPAQGPTAQQPRDARPSLNTLREARPGRQGTIDPADQQMVEARFPRDDQGNPLPFRDPRENERILVSNDGGPMADPFRGNNCADQSCTEMENWFGDPQVSAPRYAEFVDGEPSHAGEDGGIEKIEALAGVKLGYDGPGADGYQHLAESLLDAGHGAAAVVVVDWGDGSSHAFNAFNHEGEILWTDGQNGTVSEGTPLWPEAKEVWSVAVDADRNPLPGYEPLDDAAQIHPEADQSPLTPDAHEPVQVQEATQTPQTPESQEQPQSAQTPETHEPEQVPEAAQTPETSEQPQSTQTPDTREQQSQSPEEQRSEAGKSDGEAGGPSSGDAPSRDGRPSAEEQSPAPAHPAEPGAQPEHDRGHEENAGQADHNENHETNGTHEADAAVPGPDHGPSPSVHAQETAAVVDAARQAAALTRTDSGGFAPEAVEALLDGLPGLPDASPASIGGVVGKVFAGEVRLEPLGGRARSERPVYRAFVDGEPVGYVKVVPRAKEFAAELSAAERLHEAELTAFHTPDVLAVAKVSGPDGEPRGVLFSSEAPGVSIDDLLRRVPLAWDREGAVADLHSAVVGVAEGLAELHGGGGDRTASPDYLNPHIEAIRKHLSGLESRRETLSRLGIDLDQINTELERTIAAAMADPGPAGLAHGDAHLGNFLWDEHAGVSLIDAPSLHESMNAAGDPIGSPARDLALFDQRIGHFGSEYGLTPDQIADLRREFAETYARHGGPAVPEHVQALFEARAAAHRLARAVQRLEARPEPRSGPAVAAAGAALEHALGIDDSAAGQAAAGFAGELPGTPEYRRDWVAIDNLRSYMRREADPEFRAQFESEFGGRIAELQRRQSAEFKKLWKELFERKADEYVLSPEGRQRAEELLRGFTAEADGLMREVSEFADGTGIPALAPDTIRGTIDREGTAAWEASLQETQDKINKVLENVTYEGHPIGFIGSMKTGWRGAHKAKTHFDPHDFDVDLYVVVDQETYDSIAAAYPNLDNDDIKIMPDEDNPPDLVDLAARIGRALKEQFPDTPGIENSTIAVRSQQPW
jgi:hypothetical protein